MKNRIGYIDMSKGLAIILVIIGHSSFCSKQCKVASLFIPHTVVLFLIWFYFEC